MVQPVWVVVTIHAPIFDCPREVVVVIMVKPRLVVLKAHSGCFPVEQLSSELSVAILTDILMKVEAARRSHYRLGNLQVKVEASQCLTHRYTAYTSIPRK